LSLYLLFFFLFYFLLCFSYLVKDGDRVYASARSVLAPFDYQAYRPRRLTQAEAGFFAKYLDAAPAPA